MKKIVTVALVSILYSCQSVTVKDNTYQISKATVELGTLGEAKSLAGVQNNFETTAYPQLNEKIKVQVNIVPFTKRIHKINTEKALYNQKQMTVKYVDSLPVKPELLSIEIADKNAFINELNSESNQSVLTFIQNNERTSLVSGILTNATPSEIEKIRQADTFYLVQTDKAKYQIALYKEDKKTGLLYIDTNQILGYEISTFCWTETSNRKWQIGDLVSKGHSCSGLTTKKVKEAKEKSLYRM
ncbi:conserved hypothetical protein [Flavobacterium sp. 9AF]|uniref:hypothetical protein n=1 Tax=Flavobacterium sp. 9AF TaxID=2653142 RepID=UPI0012F0118A|nr:hypothetical protein [Flavobacterium sp. 9AF]VXB36534.1 conserved hypothetical protein [Flavobacterium sp. 9AF]